MLALGLQAIGEIPSPLLEHLAGTLSQRLNARCEPLPGMVDPSPSYHADRAQYNCRILLPELQRLAEQHGSMVLGVADVDLFSPIFTFVFGEAHLGGVAGLFSLFRLHASFYGLREDRELLWSRADKEAVHECGHLLGLKHCIDAECVMRFSGAAEEVDLKSDEFCEECRRLRASLAAGAP